VSFQESVRQSRASAQTSVVVATYRRLDRLAACLDGLQAQSTPPNEVIVVVHAADADTAAYAAQRQSAWPVLRCERVAAPGLVNALNCGLEAAHGAIVAFIDDDAVPAPDWLERILDTYRSDGRIAAVGGRDIIHRPDGSLLGSTQSRLGRLLGPPRVGRIQWCGRMLGNHHQGVGEPQDVDILKGVNMSYRRTALEFPFDERLHGTGALPHSEMSICLPLRRRGLRVVYDPRIVVDHYPAPRRLGYERDEVSLDAISVRSHNEALAILDFFGRDRRLLFVIWALLVGTTECPGFAVLCRDLVDRRPRPWLRFAAAQRGRVDAWGTRRLKRRRLEAPRHEDAKFVHATLSR
jgi:glycosyltransferase involved in cell wall biosynthesis